MEQTYVPKLKVCQFENNNYSGLDLFKFLISFLIVSIHTSPLSSYSPLLNYGFVNYFCRVGVPFFFIVSGFFCYKKVDLEDFDFKIVIPYLKRLFILYLCWSILHLPTNLYSQLKSNRPLWKISISLIKGFFIGGWSGQLWFLISLIYTVIIVSFLIYKRVPLKTILLVSFFLFVLGHINNIFRFNTLIPQQSFLYKTNHLVLRIINTPRDSVFMGFFYFTMGLCISKGTIKVFSIRKSIIGYIVSMGLLFGEIYIRKGIIGLDYDNELSIFLVPSSYFVFCIGSQIELSPLFLCRKLRKYSTLIYCSHIIFGAVLSLILKIVRVSITNSLLRFIIICFFSLSFSFVVVELSDKKGFKFLKSLY